MYELGVASELAQARTLKRDRKQPDIDVLAEKFNAPYYEEAISLAAGYAVETVAEWRAHKVLSEAFTPITPDIRQRGSIRNAFLLRSQEFGNFPAFSNREMQLGAFGLRFRLSKARKEGLSAVAATYDEVIALRQAAVRSIEVLHQAIDGKSGDVYTPSPRLVRSGEVKDEIISYLMAMAETRRNSRRKEGSNPQAADWRYWEYCLDAATDEDLVKAWKAVYEGQKARMKFLGNEISEAENHPLVRALRTNGAITLRTTLWTPPA